MSYSPNTLFAQTANATVANSTAETTLIGTGVGAKTFLANSSEIGSSYVFLMCGYHSSVSNPNLTIRVKLGTTTILTSGSVQLGNSTNEYIEIRGEVTVRTTGASGTIFAQGFVLMAGQGHTHFSMSNTSAITVDTTVDQISDITAQWAVANAGNTITITNFTIRKTK